MKNRKLLGLLALASCVMLGGCNGGNDPQPTPDPKPDPTPVVEVEIRVSPLPATLVEGDVLDLEEYVTVIHASSYSVELAEASKQFASVDGHKITVTGEGDISFVIKAGDKTKECSLYGVSEVRAKLSNVFKNCTTDYSALQLIYLTAQEAASYGMGSEAGYYSYDCILHGEGFVLDGAFEYDEEGYPIVGGFVDLGDNEIYAMTYNENTGKFACAYNTVFPSYYFDFFNPSFPIDFNSLKLFYDDEYEEYGLRVEGKDALNIAEGVFFIMNGESYPYSDETRTTYDVAQVSAINFYLDDEGEEGSPYYCAWAEIEYTKVEINIPVDYDPGTGHGEIPEDPEVYIDSEMPYILDATNTTFDSGYVKAVKKVVGNKEYRPEGVDYFNLTHLDSFMYGVVTNPSFNILFSSYWSDLDGSRIEAPEELGDYSFLKESYSIKFVSEDGFISYKTDKDFVTLGDVASGLVMKDGHAYDVEGEFTDLHGYASKFNDPSEDLDGNLRSLFVPGVIENNLVSEAEIIGATYFCPTDGHGVITNPAEISVDETTGTMTHTECGQEIQDYYSYAYYLNIGRQNSFITALCNADPALKSIAAKFTALGAEGDDFWSWVQSTLVWDQGGAYVTLYCTLQWDENQVFNIEITVAYDGTTTTSDMVSAAVSNLIIED